METNSTKKHLHGSLGGCLAPGCGKAQIGNQIREGPNRPSNRRSAKERAFLRCQRAGLGCRLSQSPTCAIPSTDKPVLEDTQFAPGFADFPRRPNSRGLFIAAERERWQLAAGLAAFRKRLRAERRAQHLRQLASFWPVALGLVLGAFAPALRTALAGYAPWITTAVFPLFLLAGRSPISMSFAIAQTLPLVMLYAQFPLEGLLVRMILTHRVTVFGVCGQVCCLHILGAAHLWLLNGALDHVLAR